MIISSMKGSRRRATKNHKSKAELLNPEEGEGDLAIGQIHSHTHTHQRQQVHRDAILSCISAPPEPPLLLLLCSPLFMLHFCRPLVLLLLNLLHPA